MVYGESAVLSSRLEKTYKVVSSEHIYFRPYVRPASVSTHGTISGDQGKCIATICLCVCVYMRVCLLEGL